MIKIDLIKSTFIRWGLLLPLLIFSGVVAAQQPLTHADSISSFRSIGLNPRVYKNKANDTAWIYSGICKTLKTSVYTGAVAGSIGENSYKNKRKEFVRGAGDISYQHFGRQSSSDNILLINSVSDIAALRLSMVFNESYPVSLYFRYNKSNPFQQDNIYDFNISFDNHGYKELVRDKLIGVAKDRYLKKQASLQKKFESLFHQFQEQKEVIQSPSYIQQSIENRFQTVQAGTRPPNTLSEFPGNAALPDSLRGRLSFINGFRNTSISPSAKDRILDSIHSRIETVQPDIHGYLLKRKDSLERMMRKYEDSISLYKKNFNKEIDSLNKELDEVQTATQLDKYQKEHGIKDTALKGGWTNLMMKTNLRFGKFILNGSELTVNNIFLHGFSLKYGDEKFIQLSAGYYDFAFREMFNLRRDTARSSKQSIISIRAGKTDGKNLQAINFYAGKKQKPGSVNNEFYTVAGISLERKIYFNKNLDIDLEIAKSTTRYNSLTEKKNSAFEDLLGNMNPKTLGGNISGRLYLPATKTDAELNYKYLGLQFESFNASQYFNPQNNLAARINQPLFGRKLTLTSGIRYTDFKSYGISTNLKSKTLFGTFTATMRVKKLPVFSLGYYPGSQLYLVEGNKLYEYYYYILNATASHYFTLKKLPIQAVFAYNKFFNKYTDSLVNGSQSCYSFFLTTWAGRFSYQLNYSRQVAAVISLSTVEAGINYGGNKVKIGGTLKWNLSGQVSKLGYTSNIGMFFNKIGTVSLLYDRSFLPERTGVIIPVTTGQLQIIKPLKFRIWQKG